MKPLRYTCRRCGVVIPADRVVELDGGRRLACPVCGGTCDEVAGRRKLLSPTIREVTHANGR